MSEPIEQAMSEYIRAKRKMISEVLEMAQDENNTIAERLKAYDLLGDIMENACGTKKKKTPADKDAEEQQDLNVKITVVGAGEPVERDIVYGKYEPSYVNMPDYIVKSGDDASGDGDDNVEW